MFGSQAWQTLNCLPDILDLKPKWPDWPSWSLQLRKTWILIFVPAHPLWFGPVRRQESRACALLCYGGLPWKLSAFPLVPMWWEVWLLPPSSSYVWAGARRSLITGLVGGVLLLFTAGWLSTRRWCSCRLAAWWELVFRTTGVPVVVCAVHIPAG